MICCNECGEVFPHHELQEIEEHGCYESDYGVYSQFDSHNYYDYCYKCCPYCNSTDFEEGYVCQECGKFVKFFEDDKYGICYDCSSKYTDEEYYEKYPL